MGRWSWIISRKGLQRIGHGLFQCKSYYPDVHLWGSWSAWPATRPRFNRIPRKRESRGRHAAAPNGTMSRRPCFNTEGLCIETEPQTPVFKCLQQLPSPPSKRDITSFNKGQDIFFLQPPKSFDAMRLQFSVVTSRLKKPKPEKKNVMSIVSNEELFLQHSSLLIKRRQLAYTLKSKWPPWVTIPQDNYKYTLG